MTRWVVCVFLMVFMIVNGNYSFDENMRHRFKGNLALFASWNNAPRDSISSEYLFGFFSRAKYGATWFQVIFPTGNMSFVLWRDRFFVLQNRELTEESTPEKFELGMQTNVSFRDETKGTNEFDIMMNFQHVLITTTTSMMEGFNLSFVKFRLFTVPGRYRFFENITYTGIPWAESLDTSYTGLLTRGWPEYFAEMRWELFHPAFYVISLLFYILVGILIVIFWKRQPLRSRGVIPFYANLTQLFHLFLGSVNWYFPLETLTTVMCHFYMVFTAPMISSLIFSGSIVYSSYNIMKILSRQKVRALKSRRKNEKSIVIRFYEISQNLWVQALFILIFYLGCVLLHVIVALINTKGKMTGPGCASIATYVGIAVSNIILLLANLPISIYLDWKEIRRCQIRKLLKDPLYFKFEVYILYTISFLFFLASGIWSAADSQRPFIPDVIVHSFVNHSVYASQCLFPLIMTIYEYIGERVRNRDDKGALLILLENKRGFDLFFEFSKSIYSVENLACWRDILEYEKSDDRAAIAAEIWSLYLNRDAHLEVNMKASQINSIRQMMDMNEYVDELYDPIKPTLILNISDTFSKFRTTSTYIMWERETRILKEWDIQPKSRAPSIIELREPLL